MEKIPTEIFDQILDIIVFQKITSYREDFGHRNADLKALRLCSKRFAKLTAPYLYSSLLIFISTESFAKTIAVAEHPTYRHMVKEARVFPRRFALESPFDGKLEYAHDVTLCRERLENDAPLMDSQIDSGYACYLRMRKDQAKLLPRVQPLLEHAFSHFSQLRLVNAVRPLAYADYDVIEPEYQAPPSLMKFYEELLLDSSGDRYVSSANLQLVREESAAEIMTIIRAAALSTEKIRVLHLCTRDHFMDLDLCLVDDDILRCGKMFANLEELRLPMIGRMSRPHGTPVPTRHIDLLKLACNVQRLSLYGEPRRDAEILYSNAHFPRIASLELVNFCTRGPVLSAFIKRHGSTLRKLSLASVRLSRGSWYGTFVDIRRKGLEVEVQDLSCRYIPLGYFNNVRMGIQENEKLNAFIQGDQPWPGDLPQILLQDAQ